MRPATGVAAMFAAATLAIACTTSPTTARSTSTTSTPTTAKAESLVIYDVWDAKTRTHTAYVVDVDSRRVRPLVTTDDGLPAWSPDGRWLVFAAPRPSTDACRGCADLALVSPDGRQRRVIVRGGDNSGPVWSPDGKWIVYDHVASSFADRSELDLVRPDGTGRRRLSSVVNGQTTWSPDSRRLVVDTGTDGLWILDADGSGLRRLTPAPIFADRTRPRLRVRVDSEAAWSPTGASVAFARDDGTADPPHSSVWILSVGSGPTASRLRRLSPADLSADGEAWSPDGTTIAFVGSSTTPACFRSAVYVIRADGSGLRRISPYSTAAMSDPTWSPDSRSVAYVRPPTGQPCYADSSTYEVDVATVDGAQLGNLAAMQPASELSYVRWQP